MAKVNLNRTKIVAAYKEAFRDTNELFERKQIEVLTDRRWAWPNETVKDGRVVETSPRDIVDTGQLRDSFKLRKKRGGLSYEHAWTAEYALAVHQGAVYRNGATSTARPWVRVALREFDFEKAFAKLAKKKLEKFT